MSPCAAKSTQPTDTIRTASVFLQRFSTATPTDAVTPHVPCSTGSSNVSAPLPLAQHISSSLHRDSSRATLQRVCLVVTRDAPPSPESDDQWPAWDDTDSKDWAGPRHDPGTSDVSPRPRDSIPLPLFALFSMVSPAHLFPSSSVSSSFWRVPSHCPQPASWSHPL